MPPSTELLPGTLDLLILYLFIADLFLLISSSFRRFSLSQFMDDLLRRAVAQRVQQLSKKLLRVAQGSLDPALYRLDYKKWTRSELGFAENNRPRKFYLLSQRAKGSWKRNRQPWTGCRRPSGLSFAGSGRHPHDL